MTPGTLATQKSPLPFVQPVIARPPLLAGAVHLTTALAFGSYLLAEQLGFSGVLAVVAAGLVSGNFSPESLPGD